MKRFKAICDQTRSRTWHVLDRETGSKVLTGAPAFHAKECAAAMNCDKAFADLMLQPKQ